MKHQTIALVSVLLSIAAFGCSSDSNSVNAVPNPECDGGVCPGAACDTPGVFACSEDKKQLLVCGTDNQYRVEKTCADRCDAGKCVNENPGPVTPECNEKTRPECSSNTDRKVCEGDKIVIKS